MRSLLYVKGHRQIKMKTIGLIYVILASIGWGTAGVFVNGLNQYGFDSLQNAMGRCTVSAIFLLIFMLIKYKRLVKITWKQLIPVAIEGISFYGMAATFFYAITYTSASTASMLLSIAPVFVTIVSVIFFQEKMTLKKGGAIVLSLVGCSLVVGIFTGFKFDLFGIIMGLLGGLFYASYSICTKIAMRSGMEPDVNITYSFCFSALASLLLTDPITLCTQISKAPIPSILLMIGVGIVTGAFAGLMYSNGMKRLPAGIASAMAVLEPIISTLLSVFFLHEVLGATSIIGIVLVLTSVVMLSTEK